MNYASKIRRDALEIILGFSLLATDIMFFPKKPILNKKFREVIDLNIDMGKKTTSLANSSQISNIVFSILAMCAGLVPVHLLYAKTEISEAYDEDN
jgi:hypothetical protein